MREVDIGIGVVAVIFSVLYGVEAIALEFHQRSGIPGPGFLPTLLAITTGIIGVLLIATRLFGPADRFARFEWPSLGMARRSLGVWLAFVAAIIVLPVVGFVVAATAMVAVLLLVVEGLRSKAALATIVVLPLVFDLVFAKVLSVRLPVGPWGF